MHLDNLPEIIFRSIFIGFACWTFVWVIAKRVQRKQESTGNALDFIEANTPDNASEKLVHIDQIAIGLLLLAGIYKIIKVIIYLPDPDNLYQAFGEHWVTFWIYPFTHFMLPQLFWIKKFRNSNFFRIAYAVWAFGVLHIVQFIILITSSHRDYETFDNTLWLGLIIEWSIYLAIFAFLVTCGILLSRIRPKRSIPGNNTNTL
jgi:hypothetical protein